MFCDKVINMQDMQVGHDVVFNVSKEIKELIKSGKDDVHSMLLKCVVQVSPKVPLYCALIGR